MTGFISEQFKRKLYNSTVSNTLKKLLLKLENTECITKLNNKLLTLESNIAFHNWELNVIEKSPFTLNSQLF